MEEINIVYQNLDPLHSLRAEEEDLYVDWQRTCRPGDIKRRLANSIARTGDVPVTRLITGHRGIGKTTELNRVKQLLETGKPKCFVSMLQASEWVDMLSHVDAPDLVWHMVQQLVQDLRGKGFELGLSLWTQKFQELREILESDVELKSVSIDVSPFKFTSDLKQSPSLRRKFRKLLEDRLPSLYDLVNEEILAPARIFLKKHHDIANVVLIVDEMDRYALRSIRDDLPLTNHEELFIHSASVFRSLKCDILLTIPMDLSYSRARGQLDGVYGAPVVTMPVVAVRKRDGTVDDLGVSVFREALLKRAKSIKIFAEPHSEERIIQLSGGHFRAFLTLLRSCLDRSDGLPLTHETIEETVVRAVADLTLPLRRPEWQVLEEVHSTHKPPQDVSQTEVFNSLLANFFIYYYQDDKGDWLDWNPLLAEVDLALR